MDYTSATNEQLEQLLLQRDYEAIRELAERCRTGTKGQEKNLTRAANLYHKGEKQGLTWAYQALGDMYAYGEYFGQNTEIANEYYQKAGVAPVGQTGGQSMQTVQTQTFTNSADTNSGGAHTTIQSIPPTNGVDTNQIQQLLANGENSRQNGDTVGAKSMAEQALAKINQGKSGAQVTGGGDLQMLEIDTYWLLAYIAFNEGQYQEMDNYLEQPGVYALHPWGAYLAGVVHQNNGAPDMMLENDMQRLIEVNQNPNMSTQERGDVLGLIGDLYLRGLRSGDGDTNQLAYSYYKEAGNCGNAYAAEQAGKFKTTLFGNVKYTG